MRTPPSVEAAVAIPVSHYGALSFTRDDGALISIAIDDIVSVVSRLPEGAAKREGHPSDPTLLILRSGVRQPVQQAFCHVAETVAYQKAERRGSSEGALCTTCEGRGFRPHEEVALIARVEKALDAQDFTAAREGLAVLATHFPRCVEITSLGSLLAFLEA